MQSFARKPHEGKVQKDHGLQCCPCNSHPTIGFHNHACIVKDTKDAKRWWKRGKRVAPNMTISMKNKFYFQYIIGHAYWLHPAFCWSYSTHADFQGPSNQWPRHVALFFTHARCEILGNGAPVTPVGVETVAMDPCHGWSFCIPMVTWGSPMTGPWLRKPPYWYDIPQFETYPQWQASRKAVLGRRLAPAHVQPGTWGIFNLQGWYVPNMKTDLRYSGLPSRRTLVQWTSIFSELPRVSFLETMWES